MSLVTRLLHSGHMNLVIFEVQSLLYEDAMCLKRVSKCFEDLRYRNLSNNGRVIIIVYAKRNNKQSNCYCSHKVANSATQNCANNKEFELKLKTTLYFICTLWAHILKAFKR